MLKPRHATAFDPQPKDGDITFGDLHADFDGFIALLKAIHWNPDTQRIFLLGDMLDRGNKAKELLDFKKEYGVFSILGNHCYSHNRYAYHETIFQKTKKKNPIHLTPEKKDTLRQFGDIETYIEYMLPLIEDCPAYLPFEDSKGKGYLMHAGPDPFNTIEDQNLEKMLVRRFHPSPNNFIPEETEEYKYWQKSYTGHLGTIISGHHPVPTWHYHNNPYNISLDGGSCMGQYSLGYGKIRCMKFGSRAIFEGPASPGAIEHYQGIKNGTH